VNRPDKPEILWAAAFPSDLVLVERFSESSASIPALSPRHCASAHARCWQDRRALRGRGERIVAGSADPADIESGRFEWKTELEDVHMNIEARLTERIGAAGKKLHTGARATIRWRPTCVLLRER